MLLTKFSHSCVRLEKDGAVLVVDPGTFSEVEEALDGADTVLVTHVHPDHCDVPRVSAVLESAPELSLHAPAAVVEELGRFATHIPALEWPEFLSEFIDHIADLWAADVSRRAVWLAVQSTPATRATAADTERPLIEAICGVLAPLIPSADDRVRRFVAGLLVHTTFSLLNFSVQQGAPAMGEEHYELTVQEVKRMLISYLMTVAEAR